MNNEMLMKKPIITAAYLRVSTSLQEEEKTIDGQRLEILERIEKDGLNISKEHIYEDDGWTGSTMARPALDKLRTDATNRAFNRLYVYDRSRISRDFLHQEVLIDELKSAGVEIIELHGISGNSPENVFSGRIMGLVADYERTKIKERMMLGKRRIVQRNGQLLGYNPCFGYDLHKTAKGKNGHEAFFTINEEQAKIVKHIFEMAAAGKSMYQIRMALKEEGVKPPRSERGVWGNTTIARLLRNTTYIGEHYYRKNEAVEAKYPRKTDKYRRVAKSSKRERPKSEWWEVQVPAIIDKDLFNKAQEELNKNKKYNRRNNKTNYYLLTGLVRCECGRARTGDPAPNHHCYYRCVNRLEKLERTCMSAGVSVPILDMKVWDTVVRVLTQPTVIQKFIDKISNNEEKYQQEIDVVNNKLKKLDEENDRYIDIFGKGMIDEQKLRSLNEELRSKKTELEVKKLELNQLINSKPTISSRKLAENMVQLLEKNLPFEDKKRITRAVVEKVEATCEEATIYGRIPVFEGIGKDIITFNEKEEEFSLKSSDLSENKSSQISERNDTKCRDLKNFTSEQVGFESEDWHCRPT